MPETPTPPPVPEHPHAAPVPWYLYGVTLASTCVIVGLLWDISWHRTIGRDAFLTPAHVAIYTGALIAGISCGWLALMTTFGRDARARDASVRYWGFRAPLGAWLSIWGSFAMLVSAPFDNWWHNAYGLDVQILSPPHTVLGVGMMAIQAGAMLMVLARQNRAGSAGGALRRMFTFCAGIALLMMATIVWEYTGFPNYMRSGIFYWVSGLAFPAFLLAPALASRSRWPATTVALVYSGLTLAMAWILPLFPATPRLAPIHNPVTHMLPPTFPLLLVVPALLMDLVLARAPVRRDIVLAVILGVVFVSALLAVQWPFSAFLLSPAARNPIFVADRWDYSNVLGPWRYEYWSLDRDAHGQWSAIGFWRAIGIALGCATLSSWIGLQRGRWMRGVLR